MIAPASCWYLRCAGWKAPRRGWFFDRTGLEIDDLVGEPLRRFVELGLMSDDGSRIKLTRAGLLVSDSLWGEFLIGSNQNAPSPSTV